ncbi:unnamed protein product [Coregonus sp. 'balchen']|nr:unnamed protein product [Coregonus sp. 'balchen']
MKRKLAMTPESETKRPRVNGFHNNTPMETASPAAETSMSSTSVVIPIDDDVMILETNSTPIQNKATFDLATVKSESRAMETPSGTGNIKTSCTGTSSVEMGTAVTNYSPPPPSSEQVSITTQTEIRSKVKCEDEEDKKKREQEEKGRDRTEPGPSTPSPSSAGPSTPGPSSAGPSSSGPSAPDPSDHPMLDFRNLSEAQEQQDQLLELMQAAAHERDQFKEQVNKLTSQLHDLEGSMQRLSQATVKSEHCHQACQTEEGEQSERMKVEIIEEERGNLWSLCETLQQDVVELRREKQEWEREKQEREAAQAAAAQAERGDGEATSAANGSTSETPQILRELRKSVGRLLVTFVPALDLEQVNYDCSVIDEILDQVLTDVESMGPV